MKDEDKTKGKLINQLVEMRQRIAKLEKHRERRQQARDGLGRSKKNARGKTINGVITNVARK